MNFAAPWFLLAAASIPVLWLLAARSRAPLPRAQRLGVTALQTIALLAAVLALAQPWREAEGRVHRVAIAASPEAATAVRALREATPFADPFVAIGAGAAPALGAPQSEEVPASAGVSDLAAALRTALATVPAGAASELVVFGDGRHDGAPLAGLAQELRAHQSRLHVRWTAPLARPDAAILALDLPPQVQPGEAFRLLATVEAARATDARCEIRAGDAVVATSQLALRAGTHRYPIDCVLPDAGVRELRVDVTPAAGAAATAIAAVLVEEPLRILHLAPEPSRRQSLAASLAAHGIDVVAPDPSAALDPATLAGCAAVLVDDLAADAWPRETQTVVRDAVLQRGLGLVLAGTHQNLGPGGYGDSPLAAVLPVRMPQREERRDPSISLVLIVDTSGSMGGGRIELAKEVARLAVQKMQPHDKVGIVEFYGSKRWAAPLQPATNTIEITRALNRLQAGGGTIIYDALEESYYALLNARTRFQHILVLTDGGVESGPFEALARRMAAAGQTLSTVLIGPQANSPFLLNLAQWGRGRFYACPDRFQLPELQFREPQSALLPAVQERRLPLARSAEAEAVAAFAGDELPPTGGLVEASARDGAEVLIRGVGGEPFLVGWDQGAGRVLVMAGQTLGPQSGELRADPSYGAFLADLLRSAGAGRTALAPRLDVAVQARGARVALTLPAGTQLPRAPEIACERGAVLTMVPAGGSVFEAFVPWPDAGATVLTARCGDLVLARGAGMPPSPTRPASAREDLVRLAAITGGTVADVGADAALPPLGSPSAWHVQTLASTFGLVALIAFLLSVLLRRLPLDGLLPPRGAALWLVGALACAAGAPAHAQEPTDPAGIRAAIDAELRRSGDLAALAKRWQNGTPRQQLELALALGDLDRAAALCGKEPLAGELPALRVDLLDILGRPQQALAAMPEPPAGTPLQQAEERLRRALLLHATNRHDDAKAELQRAASTAQLPAFDDRTGLLAGMLGYFDLALQLHRPRGEEGRLPYQAALRRGLWQLRRDDHAAAIAEFERAYALAPLQRDGYFALSQVVAAARTGGTLPALADRWMARARADGAAMELPALRVLFEVLRELGRAEDGIAVLGTLDGKTRQKLEDVALDLALAAGDPDLAVQQLRSRLEQRPGDAETRNSLAVLLADLQRDADSRRALQDGIATASARDLRLFAQTASELGFDETVGRLAAAFSGSEEPGAATDAALLLVAHEQRQGRTAKAAKLLLDARQAAERPGDKLRIAEQLESVGKQAEAIALYRELYAATGTEDLGLRLAWLLSNSKDDAERKEAVEIFRRIWTTAGSAARRVQAQSQVLDLAAREGTLADLAIELEQKLADPTTENRRAMRDALVEIYGRARDTFGAVQILRQWAREEPEHAITALEHEARVYLAAEEFKNHERSLLRLLELDPERELDYRQQLAMSALERGRAADARAYLRGLLDRPGDPDQVAIEFAAGVYALAGLHDEAVRLYRRALAVHPERVETFLLLGNALRDAGQRERAIGTFQELLLRPLPDDLFVVAVDGLLNMEAGRDVLAAAARAVRLRLSARPDQVFLHRVLQDLLETLGDDAGRLAELQDTVVAGGEQRTNFVRELMQEAESRRDWKTYAQHGRTLLLLGDEVPPAVFLSLGEALLQLGDLDAATRAFARARMANDFASVEVRMAELYEQADRLAEAERIRRRILRRKPDDAQAMFAVALLAERQGARDRALPLYLRLCSERLGQELPAVAANAGRPGRPGRAGAAGSMAVAGGAVRLLPSVQGRNTKQDDVPFEQAFAGVLRCARAVDDVAPLLAALRQELGEATAAAAERQLAAAQFVRRLALAFDDDTLTAEARAAEDRLLAADPAPAPTIVAAIADRRLAAGELTLAGAALERLPAASENEGERTRGGEARGANVEAQRLRLLLLQGDDEALLAAAQQARPTALPDVVRTLLLAGKRGPAEQIVALLEAAMQSDPAGAGAAAVEASRLIGRPIDDTFLQQHRLEQALQREGSLVQRVSAITSALQAHRGLTDAEREAHLQRLGEQVVAAGDAAAAERLLATASGRIEPGTEAQLVDSLFAKIDQVFLIGSRTRYLAGLPAEQGLEILRKALRKFTDEEQRQQTWRILQSPGKLSTEFLLGVVKDLRLDKLSSADRSMMGMVASRAQLPDEVRRAFAERVQQKLPEDAASLQLLAGLQPTAAEQRDYALRALRLLGVKRELETRESSMLDGLLELVTNDDARTLLQELPGGGPLLLKVALLRRTGDKRVAAELLVDAAKRKPEDTSLLYQAARFVEGEGMLKEAAELYRAARERAATFYPYQAQQLARIELELGNHEAALEALQAAKDPMLTNYRLFLAAIAGLDDAARREQLLRSLLQQRNGNSRSMGIVLFRPVRAGGKDDGIEAALRRPRLPALSSPDRGAFDEAPSDFDLLGWMPEGEAAARDQLRTMSEDERDADLGIYRGLLASARRNGTADAILQEALATLASEPFDAESLRVALAAAEIGMSVPKEVLRAELLRRASDRGTDATAGLVEILGVAEQAGDRELTDRILRVLLSSTAGLTSVRMRPFVPGILSLAAERAPDLLLQLAPVAGGPRHQQIESELLAALTWTGAAERAVEAWRGAMADSMAEGANVSVAAMLLPWCGLQLAAGEVDGALHALEAMPEFGLLSAEPHLLGAAIPTLSQWRDPAAVGRVADALVAGAAARSEERRGVFVRLGAVLVARLRAADRGEDADALRDRLLTAAGDLALRTDAWFPGG